MDGTRALVSFMQCLKRPKQVWAKRLYPSLRSMKEEIRKGPTPTLKQPMLKERDTSREREKEKLKQNPPNQKKRSKRLLRMTHVLNVVR
ncbi:hypothetical protein HanIR_Chr05g0223191 [Helianthus annuus]|nr:hypothetical protein HanIR_Chr05g0223191 [Helianthus annuus]